MAKRYAPRKSGYYWVKWSYSGTHSDVVWRIGFYNGQLGTWTIDGDVRRFNDTDFLQILEHSIPFIPWRMALLFWVAVGLCAGSVLFCIYYK